VQKHFGSFVDVALHHLPRFFKVFVANGGNQRLMLFDEKRVKRLKQNDVLEIKRPPADAFHERAEFRVSGPRGKQPVILQIGFLPDPSGQRRLWVDAPSFSRCRPQCRSIR
jgi:hypothetical protein